MAGGTMMANEPVAKTVWNGLGLEVALGIGGRVVCLVLFALTGFGNGAAAQDTPKFLDLTCKYHQFDGRSGEKKVSVPLQSFGNWHINAYHFAELIDTDAAGTGTNPLLITIINRLTGTYDLYGAYGQGKPPVQLNFGQCLDSTGATKF
jgi:hypothetical protein